MDFEKKTNVKEGWGIRKVKKGTVGVVKRDDKSQGSTQMIGMTNKRDVLFLTRNRL